MIWLAILLLSSSSFVLIWSGFISSNAGVVLVLSELVDSFDYESTPIITFRNSSFANCEKIK